MTTISIEDAYIIAELARVSRFKVFEQTEIDLFRDCLSEESKVNRTASFSTSSGDVENIAHVFDDFAWVKSINGKIPIGPFFYVIGKYKYWDVWFDMDEKEIELHYVFASIDGNSYHSLQHTIANIVGLHIANTIIPEISAQLKSEIVFEKSFAYEDEEAYTFLKHKGLKLLGKLGAPRAKKKELVYRKLMNEEDYSRLDRIVVDLEEEYEDFLAIPDNDR